MPVGVSDAVDVLYVARVTFDVVILFVVDCGCGPMS